MLVQRQQYICDGSVPPVFVFVEPSVEGLRLVRLDFCRDMVAVGLGVKLLRQGCLPSRCRSGLVPDLGHIEVAQRLSCVEQPAVVLAVG